jgi:hypothetical protein
MPPKLARPVRESSQLSGDREAAPAASRFGRFEFWTQEPRPATGAMPTIHPASQQAIPSPAFRHSSCFAGDGTTACSSMLSICSTTARTSGRLQLLEAATGETSRRGASRCPMESPSRRRPNVAMERPGAAVGKGKQPPSALG